MIRRLRMTVAGLLLLAGTSVAWLSARPSNQPDMTIDGPTRARVVDGALKALHDGYVFPEVAAKMADRDQGPCQIEGL